MMKAHWRKLLVLAAVILLACTTAGQNSGSCGIGAPPPPPAPVEPGPACTLQITLNKADAGYTHDLYLDGSKPDLLIAGTKNHVGAIVTRYYDGKSPLRFFIKVYPTRLFSSPYNVYSDSKWARQTKASETATLIAFEDIPYWYSDKDYNDVIIAVEKVNCETATQPSEPTEPGEVPPPSEPPPPPEPGPGEEPPGIVVPPGGATKVHVNFLEGTFKVGDLYLAGDPPELLIAKGSNKKGASARNFFAEGEVLVFFLRVDGVDFYSNDPEVALVDKITSHNYRIYFDVDWDGDYDDAIVHVVLTPPDR